MQRVVITGIGIVSCLGNGYAEVAESLRTQRSGISFKPEYKEVGLRSHVAGQINIDLGAHIDRKYLRFMPPAAAYTYIAMDAAITDAALTKAVVSNERTGIIVGSGGGSPYSEDRAFCALRASGIRRVGPYVVTKSMASTTSACLATSFKIKGVNYSVSSACSTSLHAIGNAMQLIQNGAQNVVFAGGGEEESWQMSMMFDAMGALSCKYNDTPETASRAYDTERDGFVIAGGGGVLVLESLSHALSRNAKIYAEIVGFGANSDGHDMVTPSGEGAVRCMRLALQDNLAIDYVNTHGTSTPIGDAKEVEALKNVFGDALPDYSSTKSLSGHSLGATGVQETIYSLIMMQESFVVGSANISTLDPVCENTPVLRVNKQKTLYRVLTNSFGFGGTNACLVLAAYNQ